MGVETGRLELQVGHKASVYGWTSPLGRGMD